MSEQDLEQIEITIEAAQKKVDLADTFERLQKNKDFKKLIMDHYLKDYAVRLVLLKADSSLSEDVIEKISKEIDCVGIFNSFLRTVMIEGYQCRMSIASSEEERERILEEGVE